MRQSQQKNRMRGRGRKQGNPLSRNFESNGPDVKIRGNASHIADKYTTLARDAAAAGDVVMSENYLQHAEHYNRIVAAAAAANQQRNEEQAGRGQQPDVQGSDSDDQDSDQGNRGRSDRRNARNDSRGERQDASSDADSGEDDSEQQERRARREPRNRRPRQAANGDGNPKTEGSNGKANGNSAATANGGDDHPSEAAQPEISSDAAKLPGSLIGSVEEDAVAGTADD